MTISDFIRVKRATEEKEKEGGLLGMGDGGEREKNGIVDYGSSLPLSSWARMGRAGQSRGKTLP